MACFLQMQAPLARRKVLSAMRSASQVQAFSLGFVRPFQISEACCTGAEAKIAKFIWDSHVPKHCRQGYKIPTHLN